MAASRGAKTVGTTREGKLAPTACGSSKSPLQLRTYKPAPKPVRQIAALISPQVGTPFERQKLANARGSVEQLQRVAYSENQMPDLLDIPALKDVEVHARQAKEEHHKRVKNSALGTKDAASTRLYRVLKLFGSVIAPMLRLETTVERAVITKQEVAVEGQDGCTHSST